MAWPARTVVEARSYDESLADAFEAQQITSDEMTVAQREAVHRIVIQRAVSRMPARVVPFPQRSWLDDYLAELESAL